MKFRLKAMACVLALVAQGAMAQQKTVAIANMIDIPQLLEVKAGLVQGLKAAGYEEGKNLKLEYQTAQGNMGTAAQIVRKYVGDRPDVIVTITTPMAQAAMSATKEVPIVFTVVTDPVGAKVVSRFDKPGANATGVSDLAPINLQVRLMQQFVPNLKRLGVLFNPGLDGSRYQLEVMKKVAGSAGITLVESPVPNSNDAIASMRSLVGKVDSVWIPNDVTVYAALEAIAKVAQEKKIPLFTGETRSVERGAIASIGFDYTAVGQTAAKQVAQILSGTKPGEIDVAIPNAFRTVVNQRAVQATGLQVPASVQAKAEFVNK
ncbi:ABC transporter substrate-binding protein [Noviherbaspirillum cavernae]|uniref:ABC transporter substrate-binding protein n=1 Tax=Noviherbaspirillum cavernae TaxID=2320862 RepID=A0A418X3Q9_9BURK|nr:ABC transporter substrate-binding protein [Noviherbaspirillum cavernae]RJG07097.1 ABC transporter substrate-binding protein [Noviherbaspirillum cavernae]